MRRLFPTLFLLLILSRPLSGGLVEAVAPQRGRVAAPVSWIDENGTMHRLSEFADYPTLLLPVYTRCRTACVTNVGQLKAALADSSADPAQFRVLLFSFDHTDTPAVLARYRASQRIPLNWSVGTASARDIAALLESIGFQYGEAGKEFIHPNLLIFLNSKLQIATWIYGNGYSGRDIDAALRISRGGTDWIDRHSDMLYALLLFALSAGCVALSYYLLQLTLLRRASQTPTGHHAGL
jgi:cytochrome oxidase Cu insertion factor (SCO1/SenC/PrrC family)